MVTDDRVKVLERTKSTKRTEKNLKEQKEEIRREFETACEVTVPEEEDLADYLRRVGRL